MIIDQSEEQSQQQKYLASLQQYRSVSNQEYGVMNNLQITPPAQSPRLTPGRGKSPRTLMAAPPSVGSRSSGMPHRMSEQNSNVERRVSSHLPSNCTPPTLRPSASSTSLNYINNSAKTQQTPPTPTLSIAVTPSASQLHSYPQQTPSMICRIDLSRLQFLPKEWIANTYRLYNGVQQVNVTQEQQNTENPSSRERQHKTASNNANKQQRQHSKNKHSSENNNSMDNVGISPGTNVNTSAPQTNGYTMNNGVNMVGDIVGNSVRQDIVPEQNHQQQPDSKSSKRKYNSSHSRSGKEKKRKRDRESNGSSGKNKAPNDSELLRDDINSTDKINGANCYQPQVSI